MSQPVLPGDPPARAASPLTQLTSRPPQSQKGPAPRRRQTFKQSSAKIIRWLHIYGSMISCAIVLFFSVTGLTLNHPTWFGASVERVRESSGELKREWLAGADGQPAKLEIVEHLRSVDRARGAISDFTVDESQLIVAFRAPGYTADAFIERDTGKYQMTESALGFVAVLNDLHKGRDSGAAWSWVIDISAVLLVLVSLTGLLLILYINRHRRTGLLTGVGGMAVCLLIYFVLVPR